MKCLIMKDENIKYYLLYITSYLTLLGIIISSFLIITLSGGAFSNNLFINIGCLLVAISLIIFPLRTKLSSLISLIGFVLCFEFLGFIISDLLISNSVDFGSILSYCFLLGYLISVLFSVITLFDRKINWKDKLKINRMTRIVLSLLPLLIIVLLYYLNT